MNWLTNFVRPRIRALVSKETPDNLWHKCPKCEAMIFHRDLENNLYVCQHCGHHMRLGAKKRLELLCDDNSYDLLDLPKVPSDPLKFRDTKKYTDRLRDAQQKTGNQDAILVAETKITGCRTVLAVFDFSFMGGSMGTAVGEALVTAANRAVVTNSALVIVPASGGARMQESILSLMQMVRTTIAVQRVKQAKLPYIVVFTDPTTGGVTASFAMIGDIHIAEKGCMIGFAGARVIEETIRQSLPDNFQTAEYLRDHGMVDIVVDRSELRDVLGNVLRLLTQPKPDKPALTGNSQERNQASAEANAIIDTKNVSSPKSGETKKENALNISDIKSESTGKKPPKKSAG